jgi:hypothetical protein
MLDYFLLQICSKTHQKRGWKSEIKPKSWWWSLGVCTRRITRFMTAVQVALLTIYDMCKAVDRGMLITDVKLLEKHGGKSGTYIAEK